MKEKQLSTALRNMKSALVEKDKEVVEQAADKLDEMGMLLRGLVYESPDGLCLTSEASAIVKAHNEEIISGDNDFILDVNLQRQKKLDGKYVGWAAAIYTVKTKQEVLVYGTASETSEDRVVMRAAIEGMKVIPELCKVELRSTNRAFIDTLAKDRSRDSGEDLWKELDELARKHIMAYKFIKEA